MSATGDAASRRDSGFTLVEALVVVAVTALISTLMFPAVERSLVRLGAMQAEAGLDAELAAARARAARLGDPVRFVAADDGRAYAAAGGLVRALPPGLTLAASGPVTFFPDGSSSGGRLRLAGGGRARLIEVDPVTGLLDAQTAPRETP